MTVAHEFSILIVDDEPDNFDVIETLLNDEEYNLHYAANGQEALNSLETYDPGLILLDVMMPGIDGIEVCRQIKAMPKWKVIPIIMITALSEKSDLARCLNAGADDFISKPVNGIELRARVSSMLRIKQQYDELQSLLKLREDMVKMVVHDLRNPLGGVLFGLELLRRREYSPEKQKDKINKIYNSAQSLQALIDDLLKIALLESGKVRLNLQEMDLAVLVNSAASNFEPIAANRNQVLVPLCSEEPRKNIAIDEAMMHRVLDNLLSNAIKFSPPESQIIINLNAPLSGSITLEVIDTGSGVPELLKEKIFEQYEIGNVLPEVSQIGLGLAFCKLVVEAHGGKIQVSDNQPEGSIFKITLPN
ncbi:hybrid sensor histidine kinase/response regulator [Roseofilum sp. BLCC_M154]|uniref:histidine kinase n=1 Tax=Roseofilum acuticapitatum BLCC-M154 TaxID=3022444 RepID=A0ABT7AQB7_9CYAN|nr:hybrid sensor histidine kinase/response regulator [Roseofilum acuticapitatum]MDJ1169095.1 hybrid sensor histidine kinase/response regulator [Roseofilum acuticapitatum BLCC-M154]